MKRVIYTIMALCLVLILAACGSEKQANVDVAALFESNQQYLPEMFYPDDDTLLSFLGIHAEDCAQYKIALCAEGLRADEIWLIEAKDDAALENLTQLANVRIQSKLDETESYAPDQYLVVQKAQVLTHGRYLALFISPDVDAMKASFEAAFQ